MTNDEFEKNKKGMINEGKSTEEISEYIFDIFETIINGFSESTIIIVNSKISSVFEGFSFSINNDTYIIKANNNNSSFSIERWKIADILMNIDDYEKEIEVLLLNGDYILITIE